MHMFAMILALLIPSLKYTIKISSSSPWILLYLSPSAGNRMAEPISLRRLQFDAMHIHLCLAPVGRREHRCVRGIQLEDIATTHLVQATFRSTQLFLLLTEVIEPDLLPPLGISGGIRGVMDCGFGALQRDDATFPKDRRWHVGIICEVRWVRGWSRCHDVGPGQECCGCRCM